MRLVSPRSPLLLCLLAGVLPLAAAPVASARLNLSRPPSVGPAGHAPGVPTPAPSPAALARSLALQTGLTPAQVTAINVCAAPAAGRAACAAQTLVRRSDHALVHPRVHAGPTFTQGFPRHRSAAGAAAATPSQAAPSAPAPGTPAYLQQAYDLSFLSQTEGGGDTVAIVDAYDDPNAESDLGVYRAKFGLPACTTANGCFRKVNQNGAAGPVPSGNSSWENEESLDLDAVSALCPNCHITLVETNDNSAANLDAGIATAAGLGANQVSNSWSTDRASAENDPTFPGVSLIAATGDHGYPGAGTDAYPAALPGYTAAGGTTLSVANTAGNLRGFSESAWSLNSSGTGWGGTSGCDRNEAKPGWQADTGCAGRSYADVSADANPNTGLSVYDSGDGGWLLMGGTSLATPLIAAFEAITGVNGTTAQWAYTDSGLLNDPTTGSSGTCAAAIAYICNAQVGYDGPTGAGSISGAIVAGAPGVGGPSIGDGSANTYAQTISATGATLAGGVYPNRLDTTYYWQYGATTAYGEQTPAVDAGAGAAPVAASGQLTGLSAGVTYHYRLVAANSDGVTYGYDDTLTTSTVTNVAPVDTTAPSISGSALQGQTLTASPGTWTPAPGGYTYQWQASTDGGLTWSSIAGATASTYQVAAGDLGAEIGVIVTATDGYGSSSAVSAPAGPVGSGAPVVTGQPVVSGSPDQGQVLSAVSTWAPAGAPYTYQWQSSADGATWTNIPGATGATYQLQAADLGAQVRVVIGAANPYGSGSATSSPVGPIAASAPINAGAPTIGGGAQRTDTLTATAGSWSGTAITYSYQWQRSADGGTTWTNIDNAGQPTYVLQTGDEGDSVRVLVTAANASGVTSAPSAGTQMVAPYPPAKTAAPAISGTAVRGSALNATQGTWAGPGNQYSYQWQRDAGEGYVDIVGATAARYTLAVADEGATVRVIVSATNPDATISVPSAPTAPVAAAPPANTRVPTIAGTAQRGYTLSAGVGVWSGVDNAYAYQWQSSTDGTTWTSIAGATGATYTLAAGDEAMQLRVLISATNEDGSAGATSAPTAAIAAAPPVDTTAPTISGSAQRGIALTSIQGTWTGIGNAYALQWQRSADGSSWTNIPGATGTSYTLAVADEGDEVRLLVTASNPDGTVGAPSGPTSPVQAAAPADTTIPAVTGTPQRSHNLIANVGTWVGIGNSYSCQWQRSTDGGNTWVDIAAATGWAHTVAVADEGAELRARVTATNADGPSTAASAPTAPATGAPPVSTSAPTIAGAALRGTSLNSTEGAWSGIGNSYAYQWQRSADGSTWANIPGATGTSYTLTVADEGDEVRLLVTVTNPDGTVSAASATTATVAPAAPLNTAAPSIAGSAQRGIVLVSGQGTWNGIGNGYVYQWQRSADGTTWTNIARATNATYTLGVPDEGDLVRLALTATNADGSATAASAATSTVSATPPVNTTSPAVSGSAVRGQTLTSTAGTWLGIGNGYVDQWQRSTDGTTWTSISGATGTAYQVGVGDEGSQLRLVVYATNLDGTVSAASAPTAVVPAAPPVSSAPPAVTGTAARGNLFTAMPGTWSGIGNALAYQWQRSTDGATWIDIVGATSTTYTLGVGDEGAAIRVLVTASNPDGTAAAPSAPTATVAGSPPTNTVAPTLAGIARRGNTLTATAGVWSGPGNQSAFQWQHSADGATWTNIVNATNPSYTLQASDEGDVVRVLVTVTNPDAVAAAPSQTTAVVVGAPPVNTGAPALLGSPQRTVTLNGTSGSWTGAGNTLTYQWQRSRDGGTTWTPIPGATGSAYTLTSTDEGDNVRLLVTATNPDGTVVAATAPSAAIQAAPPLNSAPPTIQGTPRLGAALLAQPGTWSPSDVAYAYAWQRGDPADGYAAIPGATGPTYTLTAADVGETVRVVVTATNPDGAATAASSATATVAQPPANLIAPAAPSGTLMAGDVLTPDTGMWDSPATYGFSWLRCPAGSTSAGPRCTIVSGASTYTLTTADVGSDIAVTVTATSPGGTASATSALTGPVAGAILTNTAPPSITGDPQVPNTLYANPGSWTVALTTASYDWQRCDPDGVSNCVDVGPGTAHYTLSAADGGHTIVLVATVTAPGRTATAQSPPLTVSSQPLPQSTVLPAVSGTPTRTSTLSATGGAWTNHPTSLAYQWERCDASGNNCQPIPGATQTTYQLTNADEGATVAVAVTAANASGSNTAVSHATGVVAPLLPIVARAPGLSTLSVQQGVPVSVSGAGWRTTSNTTYATSWERCSAAGTACQVIAGATATSYTPTAADVGHTLVGVITATDVDGSVPSPSPPSQVVLPAAPRWRDLPVLDATGGDVGDTVTDTPGVWTGPAVTSDTTQVMRCTSACVAVGSAARYTIASADVGAILRLRETAANAGGTTAVWSAQYVGPVAWGGSASAVLLSGQAVLRNAAGTPLALAQVTGSAPMTADAVMAHARRPAAAGRVVRVRRARAIRGHLRAWVCPVAPSRGAVRGTAPPPCTRKFSLGASWVVRLPASMTGRVRIVVVRRR